MTNDIELTWRDYWDYLAEKVTKEKIIAMEQKTLMVILKILGFLTEFLWDNKFANKIWGDEIVKRNFFSDFDNPNWYKK